ncbi:NAD(P)/FAD-dependent oxidoreductase [Prauserella flavalba]|uniref:NAD(P)/FAD-dependent oxidoreductase n=1 Tax=Prauserella flavalba TaxID=1477506 RepID=UPI0036E734AC
MGSGPDSQLINGDVSFWLRQVERKPRAPLDGGREADVAIVGGGLTGLWTAYYLKKAAPDLDIVVLEKEFAGFGASGRNGGWISAEPPGQLRRYAAKHGPDAARRLQQAMFSTIDEIAKALAEEGVDADQQHDGVLHVARNPAQEQRALAHAQELRHWGWGSEDLQVLDADETARWLRVEGARRGVWTPHGIRIHPAKLVVGLAEVVERLGVTIHEGSPVERIEPGAAVTSRGSVRARVVVRALEGYTRSLRGNRRTMLPMNSSMIVTEPLPDRLWQEIGWERPVLLGDDAHSFTYAQKTADGRIAVGGRGVPYNAGSRFDRNGATAKKTVGQLKATLRGLFPVAATAALEHTWTGVLGVPRDWCASVRFDAATGLAEAGGYVGHGLTGTNLAARTLRDLILGDSTELTALPWVGRTTRSWEPEPLRWIGARSLYATYRLADRLENRSTSSATSVYARIANLISGR